MAIDIMGSNGDYVLEYTLYGSEYATNWQNEHTESVHYMDYSKREAIRLFKQHLREKFPNYDSDF